ncbi:MAG: helix-turn-helix transcriptional regulator [Kiritimatiellales bacterium]
MQKSIHSDKYAAVMKKLVEMRAKAGWTQRQLAEKLQREHSFVWRIENGERRLDVVEFYWVCKALGYDAAVVYAELADAFSKCK